eukprot:SAG22_NODE_3283_length_1805_cov_11.877101_3_plen_207_part_01
MGAFGACSKLRVPGVLGGGGRRLGGLLRGLASVAAPPPSLIGSLSDEAALLGSLAAMFAGRAATEAIGLSGELGCLLAGVLVAHPSQEWIDRSTCSGLAATGGSSPRGRSGGGRSPTSAAAAAAAAAAGVGSPGGRYGMPSSPRSPGGGGGGGGGEGNPSAAAAAAAAAPGGAAHVESGGERAARVVTPVRDLLIAIFFASCGGHLS